MSRHKQTAEEITFQRTIGRELNYCRRRAKKTRDDLAFYLGCEKTHITRIESGESAPTAWDLSAYVQLCDLNAQALMMTYSMDAESILSQYIPPEEIRAYNGYLYEMIRNPKRVDKIDEVNARIDKLLKIKRSNK